MALTNPTPPPKLRTHTIQALGTHTHTIIFLHGRGSNATEFALELFESHASKTKLSLRNTFPSFKWIFPSAPLSIEGNPAASEVGREQSQWFDIWNVAEPQEQRQCQKHSLGRSVDALVNLVNKEILEGGIPSDHIFLAGISQGAATAAHALFRLDVPLGGLLGFCTWLPFAEEVKSIASTGWNGSLNNVRALTGALPGGRSDERQLETVVYLAHSRDDKVVPIQNGWELRDGLEALGMKVEWHEYGNGAHWFVEPEGIDDLAAFLRKSIARHYLMDKRLSRPALPMELIIPDDNE